MTIISLYEYAYMALHTQIIDTNMFGHGIISKSMHIKFIGKHIICDSLLLKHVCHVYKNHDSSLCHSHFQSSIHLIHHV